MSQVDERRQAEEELMKEGLKYYPFTLLALREFRANIQRKCRKLLEDKLDDLAKAMVTKLYKKDISSYANPDSIPENYNGNWAWIAVRIPRVEYLDCYFGLTFSQKDNFDMLCQATAMMAPGDKKTMNILLTKANSISPKFVNDSSREVSVNETLDLNNPDSLENKLDEAIDLWIDFWKIVGGVNNLLK
ncbi:MAG TPA: hypothetical protein VKF42_09670 [Chitinivibrionales bacterium]|jgi:hypothetical protein|nr:hypothetical protein [Chitinivibrionales bacterium]